MQNLIGISIGNVNAGAPAIPLLLDKVSGASLAFSLDLLSNDYSGDCLVVRRLSDDAEESIPFKGGSIDTATMEAFCSGTDGFVKTLYGQDGSGNDATQTGAANQPKIVSSGTTLVSPGNGRPAMLFDGVNDYFTFTPVANSIPVTSYGVFHRASSGIPSIVFARQANNEPLAPWWNQFANDIRSRLSVTNNIHSGSLTETGDFMLLFNRESGTNNSRMRKNGSELTAVVDATTPLYAWSSLGNRNASVHNGYMQEAVLYLEDKQTDFSVIEADVNERYGIWV